MAFSVPLSLSGEERVVNMQPLQFKSSERRGWCLFLVQSPKDGNRGVTRTVDSGIQEEVGSSLQPYFSSSLWPSQGARNDPRCYCLHMEGTEGALGQELWLPSWPLHQAVGHLD